MHASRLHSIDAAYRSSQFAFQRAQMVDVLNEGRRAKGIGLVENLVPDTTAFWQSGFGKLHAQPGDVVLRHHDDGAVALELIGDRLALQVLDYRCAVVDRQVSE